MSKLSRAQQTIYDAINSGKSAPMIMKELGITSSVLQAQVTRIRHKGIMIEHPEQLRSATNPSSNQQALKEAEAAGPANYDVEGALKDVLPEMHDMVREVHPMVMFGITIQFMKTCGGRIHAHQMIEDVYAALRLFVGDTTPDKGGETTDLLEQLTKLDLDSIKEKLEGLTGDLGKVLGAVKPQEPVPASESKES